MRFLFPALIACATICLSCGTRPAVTDQSPPSKADQRGKNRVDADEDAKARVVEATLELQMLQKQRGDYEEFTKSLKELQAEMQRAGREKGTSLPERPTYGKRTSSNSSAGTGTEARGQDASSSAVDTHDDPVMMVYGMIPRLKRMKNLSDDFLQRYEVKGEKLDFLSPDATELCKDFFLAGRDAGMLIRHEQLTHLDKSYSDAIEQLHPVVEAVNHNIDQLFALGLTCHWDESYR